MDFGTVCEAYCDAGYQLYGNKYFECLSQERWDTTVKPICESNYHAYSYNSSVEV